MNLTVFSKTALLVIPLILSASSDSIVDLTEMENDHSITNANIVSQDSVIRLATLEDLESLSSANLCSDLAEYEITEIHYECIDTIELCTLRFDVTAQLTSPNENPKIISFKADVGPELVSVEYYPTGVWIPPHDNMAYAYYPCVERYRNYSDGSRIGPDRFYDYGHFSFTRGYSGNLGPDWDKIILNYSSLNWGSPGTESQEYYENGILYTQNEEEVEINMNAVIITENGKQFTGEDLVPHHPNWWKDKTPEPGTTAEDRFFYALGCYYDAEIPHPNFPEAGYRPSREFDLNDEYYYTMVNLCRNVPDLSPIPFPTDTKSLDEGWYFIRIDDWSGCEPFAYSNYHTSFDNDLGMSFVCGHEKYLQYLVIDGRIIHYDNLVKDYAGILNLEPTFTETKTSYGYNIHREMPHNYLGAKFKYIYDLHIKCTDGPTIIVDHSNYNEIDRTDREEAFNGNKIKAGFESNPPDDNQSKIPRPDDKYIEIDHRLPLSLQSSYNSHFKTIKK